MPTPLDVANQGDMGRTPRSSRSLRVQLVGTPSLLLPTGAVQMLERRDAALLALLALEGATRRSRVAALLWPDLNDKTARGNLRQRLFRLRQAVGESLVDGDDTLRLSIGNVDLMGAAKAIAADCDACSGELLGGHDYDDIDVLDEWVQSAREAWRRTRLDALSGEASRLESNQQIAQALRYAGRIVTEAPLLEHGHRRLMRLHYLRGDRSAALAAFETCRARLVEGLGVQPDKETAKLAALIQSSAVLSASAPPPTTVATLRPPRIIGAERAWAVLAAACAAGRSVLVDGDAGSGKSRLLGDFAASRDGSVELFRARPGDSQLAYALLAQVINGLVQRFGAPASSWAAAELARVAPRLGDAPPGRLDILRLRQSLEQVLDDWHSAGLAQVVLDDLHYADDATLELLQALLSPGPSAPGQRVTWLLSVRSREIPRPLQACIDDLDERNLTRIAMVPLDESAVRALVESLAIESFDATAWVPALMRHAGGNPLFVLETLGALLRQPGGAAAPSDKLPVPATVRQLIERRLRRLAAEELKLAQLAAIAGQDFDVELAAAALGCSALEVARLWAALEQAQVFDAAGFTHDLVQEATEQATPGPTQRALHLAVARHLDAIGGEPSRLALHWREARRWAAAAACFLEASANAGRVSQRRLEADLAGAAAECFHAADDRAGEFAARDRELRAAQYFDLQGAQVARAERLLALAASPRERCTALEGYARTLIEDVDDKKVISAAGEARALAIAFGDETSEFMAARLEAWSLARANRKQDAERLIDRYVPVVRARAADATTARALADFGCALMSADRTDDAAALFETSLQTATTLDDWGLCREVHGHMAWVRQFRGDIAGAAQSYEAARTYTLRMGATAVKADITEAILGRFYTELGRYGEAVALLEATLAKHQGITGYGVKFVTQSCLSFLYLTLGQVARATAVLVDPGPDAAPAARRAYLTARIRLAMHQGQPALHLAREALHVAELEGNSLPQLSMRALLSRLMPPDEGARIALDGCARARELNLQASLWPLTLAACDALRRAGQSRLAAKHARALATRCDQFTPNFFYAPEYWQVAAMALRDDGDHSAADAALRSAKRWIVEVALPNVPAEFHSSFLERNAVNAWILRAPQRA